MVTYLQSTHCIMNRWRCSYNRIAWWNEYFVCMQKKVIISECTASKG